MIIRIEKIINPPGINKPARRALFQTIGAIGDKLKADALKAFNARFPYLADKAKLEEHGAALLVPRLQNDTEKEYRDRVATASYFLARSGERGYIAGQLDARFGDRYVVMNNFLDVIVKVRDLEDPDRYWFLQFLDELINPNVKLSAIGVYYFEDTIESAALLSMRADMNLRDTFKGDGVKLDGAVKLNGAVNLGRGILAPLRVTVKPVNKDAFDRINDGIIMRSRAVVSDSLNAVERLGITTRSGIADSFNRDIKLAGVVKLNGTIHLGKGVIALLGVAIKQEVKDEYGDVNDELTMRPLTVTSDIMDAVTERLVMISSGVLADSLPQGDKFAAVYKFVHNDSCQNISDLINIGLRYCRKLDGRYSLDGYIKLNSGKLVAA